MAIGTYFPRISRLPRPYDAAMAAPGTADRLHFTGDDEADRLLVEEPLALLIGFELDQQVPLQKAFSGPLELRRRIGRLDAAEIAAMDPEVLDEAFRRRPALHRFPGNMARRTQELAKVIAQDFGNDASRVWSEAKDGRDLQRRLKGLPGFGDMKVDAMIAILGKRLGVAPPGWEDVAPKHMTLGDVDGPEALKRYQDGKRAYKAAMREAEAAGAEPAAARDRAGRAAMEAAGVTTLPPGAVTKRATGPKPAKAPKATVPDAAIRVRGEPRANIRGSPRRGHSGGAIQT
jgi:uncharacterized HhH-GPD family protein